MQALIKPALAAALLWALSGTPSLAATNPSDRPATNHAWAVAVEKPGLPNLHRISDALYRGAQPTAEGMQELKKMGIKTILNLRAFHSDEDEIGDLGFHTEQIYFKTWHPEDEDVIRFLQIVTDTNLAPVFVHCQHGADRTGTMCAVYRMAVCGWPKEEAICEMTQGGFGFHAMWNNLVEYLQAIDVDALKKKAGIMPLGPGAGPPLLR